MNGLCPDSGLRVTGGMWAESFVAVSEKKMDVGNWDGQQFIVHLQMPMKCRERGQIQALDTVMRELSVILHE